MIPSKALSLIPAPAPFITPDDREVTVSLIDHELGGIGLSDPSQGLQVQTWQLRMVGNEARISAPNTAEITLFTGTGITEVSLAFDQNMLPVIAYVQDNEAKLRWYDSLAGTNVITVFPAGTITPRVCLDDKRRLQYGASDVILAYVRDNNLYFRAQRDRYGIEYLLKTAVGGKIIRVGMNVVRRLQFMMEVV